MKEKRKVTLFEAYLTKEIGIEFKACLYFFTILFFYCVCRMISGSYDASILHMTEMIFCCYFIGYLQVYALGNFDEADSLGIRQILGMLVCTALYCIVSLICGWFAKSWVVTGVFAVYLMLTYGCAFLIYRTKRRIDDKKLNEDLALFQSKHGKK